MPPPPHGPIVSIGECMVELARNPDGRYSLSYGGDTFNTAVYLARCGAGVAYLTLLGDDPYSGGIIELARSETVGAATIQRLPGRTAGLYLIETNDAGERTFHYWRDRAPARELFDTPDRADFARVVMQRATCAYFSGVTLSLYAPPALEAFANALAEARARGTAVVMDGNYRPRGWAGDRDRARAVFERFWRLADIALPSLEDEQLLWGDAGPADAVARLQGLGVAEIVVKCGADGAMAAGPGGTIEVPIPARVAAVDTSAAGDSFNAAYLARRLEGGDQRAAVLAGHRLAGVVVQHRGAIVPRAATAAVLDGG